MNSVRPSLATVQYRMYRPILSRRWSMIRIVSCTDSGICGIVRRGCLVLRPCTHVVGRFSEYSLAGRLFLPECILVVYTETNKNQIWYKGSNDKSQVAEHRYALRAARSSYTAVSNCSNSPKACGSP